MDAVPDVKVAAIQHVPGVLVNAQDAKVAHLVIPNVLDAQDAQDVVIIALVLAVTPALQNAAICVKMDAICNVLIHAALTALKRVHIHVLVNVMVEQVQNTKHP